MKSEEIVVVNLYSGERVGTVPARTALGRAGGDGGGAAEGARALRDMPLHRRAEL